MKSKRSTTIIISALALVIVGVALPKLTVWNPMPISKNLETCVNNALYQKYQNPLARAALMLGKNRITQTSASEATVKSFTLFRLPLGVFQGQPSMEISVACDRPANI